jgi:hypothetical protein
MSERARSLAQRFEAASMKVEDTLSCCTDEQLQARCEAEQCTVVALATHIARVHLLTVGWINEILSGIGLADLTMDEIDSANHAWFPMDAERSKADAFAQLRENRQTAADFVHGLRDGDLDQTGAFGPFNGAPISVQSLVEQILIGDPIGHLASIESAIAAAADPTPAR